MHVVLKTVSKLLAGLQFGTALEIKQLHTDETSKRQIQVTNVVCQIIDKYHHAKLVCMTGDIIGANGTAEEQTRQIAQSFTHIGTLLEKWRLMTESMYAKDPELDTLLKLIPRKASMRLSRLLGVHLMTDTCNTARRVQSKLGESYMCTN